MRKIIYLKQEVSIGEIIDFEGMKVTVTSELINNNPNLFVVVEDIPEYVELTDSITLIGLEIVKKGSILKRINKQYYFENKTYCFDYNSHNYSTKTKSSTKEAYEKQKLLKEAKKRFPIGTKFKEPTDQFIDTGVYVVKDYSCNKFGIYTINEGICRYLYKSSIETWAEVVKPIFTTEDGVDIYKDDFVWYTYKNNLCCCRTEASYFKKNVESDNTVVFSMKSACIAWNDENKPKALEDYEDELLNSTKKMIVPNNNSIWLQDYYFVLKHRDPKLYWHKILTLISEDLNEEFNDEYSLIIKTDDSYTVEAYPSDITWDYLLEIRFSSEKIAKKALELIGDKIKYLFE